MRRTCADRNQNRLPQQLWHRGLLEQWGLSYLRFGEEFRRANHGHVKVVVSAILKDRLLERGVRKMRAVPRQQIIHPMNNGEGNMRRIHLRLRRQLQKMHDGIGKRLNLRSDIELRYACCPSR